MPVVNVNFHTLEAKRNDKVKIKQGEQLKASSSTKINGIKRDKLPNLGEALLVDFEVNTKYEPGIGNIKVGGTVIFHEKKLKSVIETKGGKIELKPDAFERVQNAIVTGASIQAMILAKELNLPPPVQLPRFVLDKKLPAKGYA